MDEVKPDRYVAWEGTVRESVDSGLRKTRVVLSREDAHSFWIEEEQCDHMGDKCWRDSCVHIGTVLAAVACDYHLDHSTWADRNSVKGA